LASAGAPPLEEDPPLDEVPPLEPPLEASPPLLDEVPPELAPLLPLLEVVASVELSSVVASPPLVPEDEETPLDAPDELPSAPPSDVLPSPVRGSALLLLPHPAAAIATARTAMCTREERWDLRLIEAPCIAPRAGTRRRRLTFTPPAQMCKLVTRVTRCGMSTGHIAPVPMCEKLLFRRGSEPGPTFAYGLRA
jgi:hypothetical protein